jgi:hypothetical protein
MVVLEFLKDNLNFIVGGVSVVAFITLLYFKFNKTHIPNLINKVTNVFAVIVSNLLGKSYGDGKDIVNKLPIVDKVKDLEKDIKISNEIKLIELKQKLISPIYTEEEKTHLRRVYDYLYSQMRDELPEEIKELLKKLGE